MNKKKFDAKAKEDAIRDVQALAPSIVDWVITPKGRAWAQPVMANGVWFEIIVKRLG